MTKDEALHKALKVLNCLNNDRVYETAWVKGAINACEEALEQPDEYLYVYKGSDIWLKDSLDIPSAGFLIGKIRLGK